MAANDPAEDARFLRRWLRRRHPRLRKKGSIVLLPKQAECFGGKLLLSLPEDFRVQTQRKGKIGFAGTESGLCLNVMELPFKRPLHSIAPVDLLLAFGFLGIPDIPQKLPFLSRGFLRHSPTLLAEWVFGNEKTALYLIQVQQTVFLLFFPAMTPELDPLADAIIFATSVNIPC